MKKIYYILTIIAAALISCSDDTFDEQQTDSLTIEKAKAWFESNIGLQNLANQMRAPNNDSTDLKPLLNWEMAELDNDSVWSVVELPWEYENGIVQVANSEVSNYAALQNDRSIIKQVIRLVILQNKKTGDRYGFKMIVVPDLQYMLEKDDAIEQNKYLHIASDLSGTVLFYSVKDEFVNGWKYEAGKITAKVGLAKASEVKRDPTKFNASAGSQSYWIEFCRAYSVSIVDKTTGIIVSTTGILFDCEIIQLQNFKIDDPSSGGGYVPYDGGGGGGGGGAGGSTGGSTTDEPKDSVKQTVPCAELNRIKADAPLIQRLKDYINKAKNESIEYGYMKTSNGTFIYPIKQTATSVSYDPLYTDKITERIHTHDDIPAGGTYVFSPGDLMSLYSMFINGKMENPATFRYIVVSAFGIGYLHITDIRAFKKFGENYNTERLDKLYLDTQKSGTDMYANLRQFLEILNNTDSGLTFSLGEFDMGSSDPDIVWDIRSLQSIDSNLKTGCN